MNKVKKQNKKIYIFSCHPYLNISIFMNSEVKIRLSILPLNINYLQRSTQIFTATISLNLNTNYQNFHSKITKIAQQANIQQFQIVLQKVSNIVLTPDKFPSYLKQVQVDPHCRHLVIRQYDSLETTVEDPSQVLQSDSSDGQELQAGQLQCSSQQGSDIANQERQEVARQRIQMMDSNLKKILKKMKLKQDQHNDKQPQFPIRYNKDSKPLFSSKEDLVVLKNIGIIKQQQASQFLIDSMYNIINAMLQDRYKEPLRKNQSLLSKKTDN